MKPVRCPAKQHTVILNPVKGSPADVIFTAEAANGSEPTGQVEERKKGIFGFNSTFHPLKRENRFRIGTFTNGFRLAVIADTDVTVYFKTRHTQVADVVRYVAIGFGIFLALGIAMNALGIVGPEEGASDPGPRGELQPPAEREEAQRETEN